MSLLYTSQLPSELSIRINIHRILAVLPNPRPINVEQIRHDRHNSTDRAEDGKSIMNTNGLVNRPPGNSDPSGDYVSCEYEKAQRRGGVYVVGVDEIHVRHDEDGHGSEAEDNGGDERRPDGD